MKLQQYPLSLLPVDVASLEAYKKITGLPVQVILRTLIRLGLESRSKVKISNFKMIAERLEAEACMKQIVINEKYPNGKYAMEYENAGEAK